MKQLAAACKAFRAAYASLLFMLMILVGASSHAYAQSGTIINPNGGNTTTDGLAIKITDTNIVVRRNGIWEAANVAGAAGDQGIRPYIIFEKRLSASGSPSIHRIQNRFISQITGTGDVSSPWQVIMTDTVSNFDHKRYTINTTISYTAGDNYFFLDYVILAPPGTESYYVHLYHSERIWMGGSGCSMGQAGELINWDEYRGPAVLLPDIVRVYRPENECSNLPFDAHIYRTSGGFTSYFASNPDLRDEKLVPGYLLRSVTNASLFPEPSKGISVHKMIEFNGTLGSSYYEPKTKRILVGYGLDTTFNGLDYTDPFVANNSTGVTVGFTADSVGVAEGDDTHILDGLKIRVSTGVLTSPQLLKIKVKPHTSAGVTNTDYEYLGALVIQPNVYATPVEIDITNILIKGNTSLQPNRSMQLELESGTPLVNIDPAANIAAYTILDDDNGKIALEPIDTLLHEGQSMQVRVKLNGGIAGEDITVTIDKGSNTDAQDEDYQVATPFPFTVTIPAGSNEATFTLTAATDQIIEKPTQLLELTATATVSGLTKFAKANVNIVDETRLNPDNMVIRIDDILGAYEGDFFWVRVSLPAGITTEEELKVTISVDPTKSTTDNADFDPIPTEITINPGESSAIIEYLSILLDDKIEFKEECWLNGYAEGFTVEPGVIEVEDVDYDPGNPWGNMYTDPFVFTIEEGDPAGVTFVVTLPGNKIAGKDFDLDLSLEGGSTAEAADFVNFPSKVTFPKNASEFRFTLYPDHDDEEESDEDAYVLLSSPYFSFYSVPVTIINKPVDNNSGDKNIKLEPEAIEVLEGGTVKVWVKLASNVAATQDLTFNIAAGSGTSADLPAGAYTFPSTVMIHTGETKASFDVVATGDNNILELARDLDIVVSGDVYGFAASADTIITIKDLTSTIPANKVISLTVPASITEGETKTITAALPTGITASYPITVSLSQVAVPSSVDAADFVGGLPTQIVIAKGAPSGMISVEAVKDHKHEPTEYLQMKPTAAGFTFGGNVNGSGNLEMSVINYDEAISMSATTTTVQEGATAVTVTVALANSVLAGENIVVNLQRDAASTAAATDFDLSATSVTILQGTNSASFTFTAKDDNILEGDEIATIRGTNVNGYTINGISFTITDKTSTVAANKVLTIASDSTSLFEGNSATVWVRLPENITTATAITVSLSRGASSDAALLASEYSFPATVTIPANGNEISFTLTATGDDNLFERNERLEINATANVWGTANNINEDVDIKDITITKAANRVVNITTPASIKEGNTGRIVFRLPAGISTTYPITFSLVNNGSTTVAADFSGGFPTEAIIPANNDSAFVTISPIADNSVEGTETLKLTAGSADGFTFNGGINIDIEDEDVSGIIALTASPLGMTEGDPAKVVTVSLPSGAVAGKDIVVNLSKNASSTASASDHSALPTSVTIKKDSSFTTFTVAALDDDLLEREETLVITGTNSDGYTVSGITLLIADKTSDIPANVAITLTADSTTILEGNSTKVFVRLPSNITTTEAITVNLSRGALSDAALQASEYSFPTTVTIPANSNEGSFTLTASADDNVLEGLENLQIAASANVFGTTSTATTTVGIADKTSTIAANKVITITAPTSIKEGETKSITASLPSGISTATPITVTLTNNGSTATAADFTGGLPTTITIASTTGSINVSPIADNVIEGTEYLKLTAAATGFAISGTIDVAIEDEDVTGKITMSAASTTITEGDAASVVTVSLPSGVTAGKDIVVTLTKKATSTAANSDHDALPVSVTIKKDSTFTTFTVHAVTDDLLERDETLVIGATNTDGYTIDDLTFTIKDKTSTIPANVAITLTADSTTILEGNNTKVFVRLPSNIITTEAITVNLSRGALSDAALQASEYSFPTTVTIPANSNEGSFTLTASADDNVLEGLENLQIAASANVFGTTSTATTTVGIADKTSTIAANKVITITAPTSIKEGETKSITASLPSGISTATPITVTLTNNGSTATAADFTGGLPTTITIASTTGSINVSPIADNTIEGTEYLKLTAAATGFTISGTIDVAIEDEEVSGTITMTATATTITEGNPATTVTVSLPSGVTVATPIVINLSKSATSTAANTDHDAIPASVTIAAGATTTTFTVRAVEDDLLENDETLVITGINSDGFTVSGITFTIKDKTSTIPANVAITLTADSTTILEGNNTKVFVRLPSNITTTEAITVNLSRGALSDAALQTNEYSFPTTVTIPANSNEGSFTLIASADDNVLEGLENLQIAASANVFGTTSTTTTTVGIADKTSTIAANKVITITAPTSIKEGETKSITASLPSGISTATPITVTLTNNGSTATAADFTGGLPTTITIASTTGSINVSPIADNTIEGTEYLKLTAAATGFTISGTIDIAIEDEEVSGNITMTAAAYVITEGDAATTVTVKLPTGVTTNKPVVVTLSKKGTSSAANTDHTTIPASVTINAGATTATFTVRALEDDILEGDETLVIEGTNTDGYLVDSIKFTIKDKTSTLPGNVALTLVADSASIYEGNSTKVTVSLPTGITTATPITVTLARGSGSSASLLASEYSFPSTVIIPAGGNEATFTLQASPDDNVLELLENLQIRATATIFGTNASATAIVGIKDITSTIPENKIITIDAPVSVIEGETKVITAMLPSNITASYAITVSLTNNGSTATAADFTGGLPSAITIAINSGSGSTNVSPVADNLVEGVEKLKLNAASAGFTINGAIDIDILDEVPTAPITMTATSTTITEGNTATTVTVSLPTGVTAAKAIVINLSKDAASTADNTDHDPIPATVTIPVGASSTTFTVKALDDNLLEGDETLTISGTNTFNFLVNSITFTIKDKTSTIPANVALSLTADSTSILEGNSTKVYVRLPNTITTTQAITVNITRGASSSAALQASEYNFPATVTIPAGSNEGSFTLTASADDNILEGLENLQIAASANVFGTTSTANVTVGIADKTSTIAANKVITISAPTTIKEGETKSITASLPTGISTATPIVVTLTNNGSTATAADFAGGLPTTITIASTTGTINISPIADNIIEGTEYLKLTATATGFTVNGTIDVAIEDEVVSGTISITAASTTITEGDAATTVTVSLPTGVTTATPIVVNLSKSATSTAANTDHDAVPASVTIAAGATTATFTVRAIADDLLENDETLVITGTNSDGFTVNGITFTIKDKTSTIPANVALTLVADSTSILEGNSTKVTVRLPSNITTTQAITVNLTRGASSSAALQASEYSFPATVTIPAGSNEGSFTLTASADDNILEGLENLQIAASANVFGTNSIANVTVGIADKTSTIAANKVITISAPTTIKEGETKPITASLPTGISTATPIVVTLTNNGSTATAADFTGGLPTTITIVSTTGTINVSPIADNTIEGTEFLKLTAAATGFTVNGTIDVAIEDEDVSGTITMTASNTTITEGDAATTVTVSLPSGLTAGKPIVVTLSKSVTSTAANTDHDAIPTSVTIAAGASTTTFTVRAITDNLLESDETLVIAGTNTDGFTVNGITFTIKDKTSTIPANVALTLVADSTSILEGNSTKVTVRLPNNITTTQAITVNLTRGAASSAALQASEYSFPATVIIPAGSNEGSFTLTASADDNILEGLENLQIAASANVFGSNSTANVTVGIADKTSTIAANKVITISAPTTIKEGEAKSITASLPTGISTATPIVITLTNNGSTATAADFTTGLPTTITIASTTGTVNISPIADNTIEGTEYLKLTATATGFTINGNIDIAIEDEEVSGTISMTAANTTITEGDAATTVTVSLPSGFTAGKPMVVNLAKSATSTAANTDHSTIPTSVTIPAGASTVTFTVSALEDGIFESDESLIITGSNTDGFNVTGITFMIKDKTSTIPANLAFTLTADSTTILEGNSTKIIVSLPTGITTTQAIVVNLTRGTASNPKLTASEYSFPATVTIPVNGSSASFILTASDDDNILEPTEDLQIVGTANIFGRDTTANVIVGIADKTSTIPENKVLTIFSPSAVKEGETQNILVSLPSGIIASYPIVVTLTNNGSTASAADFAAGFPASITINAGASNGIRSISPVKDGLLEGTERLILTATTTGFTTVGTINIDIIDEDIVGGIHMAATATTITEGDAATTVTVSLPSGVTAGKPIVVNLAKSPASTTANTDHDPIPASVTIPAGATSATFDVKALEDGLLEGDETLIITGTNPDGYVVNNITFTVKDKTRQIPANVALQISADSTSILEGNSTKVTISLPATITTSQAIMVNLTRGAATSTSLFASEYSFPSTATIPANGREVSFTLTASNDDNILELLENLQIVATADIFGTTSTANVTVGITDKTSTIAANKVITLAAPATIKEGETKAVTATLPSGITTAYPITLALTNNGSTATAADFTGGMPTSITIPAASGTGTINISPINDGIIEGTEKLSLTASATGFTINGQINIDILDGETNGTITMYASPTTITEGDAASVVTVSLPSGIVAGKDMVINLTKDASSTAASNDHDPIPATVTILQGKTTAEFNIKALTDNLLENDETLQINGTSADGYAVNSITFTIKDKTSTIPGNTALNITADSAAIFEGSTSNVWVRLPSHITTTVPITVNLARGAATDVNLLPSEYSFPASVTIPAGSNEVMFTLQATADDHLLELTESLQIAASATIFGNNASANAHIDIKDITGTIAANKVITINAPTSIKEGETKTITASLPSGIKATYDIVVTLTNNGSTASPADFTGGFPTQITITAGSTSGTVNITAIDDHLIENTERLSLTPAATGFTFIGNINVDVIDANTSSVNIRMTATNYTITEGDAATTVTVQLPTGIISTNDIIVQLHKDATSTLQDAEHDAIPTSVTIPAGKSNATFTVRVPMDDTLELAETLIINGTNTDGYVVESITFNVLDKTSQIAANRVISFTPATSDVLEGNSVSIVATLPANIYTAYPLVVNLSKNIASTASNTDHSVLPGTIVIPANAHQSAALQIDAAMDNIIGNTKTLLLNGTLTGFVINGASITIKDATGTIPSNKVITVTIDSSSIHEGSTTMVTYSLPPGITAATAITIQLRIDPASTTDAMDIAGLPVSFVIAPGESQAQFEIEINRDGERESNETLILSGVAAGYTVQKSNVMTIIGDVTFPPGTEGEKIRVPRGISPNGDGVGNDYMYIENIEKYTHNEVVVMNRWGGIVYKAYGYNNRSIRFDGKSNTGAGAGNNVTDGSYFYVIYVWNENGVRERFTGYIVIKR